MISLVKDLEKIISQNIERFIDTIVDAHADLNKGELLALWNGTEYDGEQTEVKTVAKKSVSELSRTSSAGGPGCPYMYSKGVKSGSVCGVKAKNGGTYCSGHKKYEGTTPKEKKILPAPKTKKDIEIPDSSQKILRKHRVTGHLWNSNSGMAFKSAEEKVVIGRIVDNKLVPLTSEDIETCKKYGFQLPQVKLETKTQNKPESKLENKTESKTDLEHALRDVMGEKKIVSKALGLEEDEEIEDENLEEQLEDE